MPTRPTHGFLPLLWMAQALSFTLAAPSFEQPSILIEPGDLPPFDARLAVVAYSLLCYYHTQTELTTLPLWLDVLASDECCQHLTDTCFVGEGARSVAFWGNLDTISEESVEGAAAVEKVHACLRRRGLVLEE
jgi:hypothetical protein